jgi:hypothetical protein
MLRISTALILMFLLGTISRSAGSGGQAQSFCAERLASEPATTVRPLPEWRCRPSNTRTGKTIRWRRSTPKDRIQRIRSSQHPKSTRFRDREALKTCSEPKALSGYAPATISSGTP